MIASIPIRYESVDIYTKQCSVGVNVKQLAQMGATLANNGINPVTGRTGNQGGEYPAHLVAPMTMAGLYDGSGGWAWHVGLPAKSGVGWRNFGCCSGQRSHRRVRSAAR